MKKDLVETPSWAIPNCDLCREQGKAVKAIYDAKTIHGWWAYLCEEHFNKLGIGLGLGKGQKLVLKEDEWKRKKD